MFAWICFSVVAWAFLIMPVAHRHVSGSLQGGEARFPGDLDYTKGGFEHPNDISGNFFPDTENNFCDFCEFLFSVHYTLHTDTIIQRTAEVVHFHIGIPSGMFNAAFSSLFNKGSPY